MIQRSKLDVIFSPASQFHILACCNVFQVCFNLSVVVQVHLKPIAYFYLQDYELDGRTRFHFLPRNHLCKPI